jgi:hypothetical protein
MKRSSFLFGLLFVAFSGALSATQVEDAYQLESIEARGTVGAYTVGLNYTVRGHTELVAAHYFYASQLKDIPLTGSVQGELVELKGTDGSVFHLRFVGNGSNGTEPLTFYNSVGLSGQWMLGPRTLPVNLRMEHSTNNPGQPLYVDVTSQPDAAFEAMVQAAQKSILAGDRIATAKYIDFPLTANLAHEHIIIHNAVQLQANWSRIFTPAFLSKLRNDIPHEMFVHEDEAMLGDGELWFDSKGIATVNAVE